MVNEAKAKLKEAEEFAHEHVREIAVEILEWQDTAVLRHGRLRELAAICTYLNDTHALKFAESLVVREALMIVANSK